ncbi:uncharacterized protein J8A68_000411 [[Candida] subhashii]|uniref:Uncharacterized protein n=1 Tax=[Candida] subhashii TaxID=561895 RepID=A0A8J5QSX5_9ASCO|nr:uncharacterized protein J8A68_000411 [[Candida] subhashii]KAG7665981.1 hypothetical protein J8A68_000411 [[Candida] subhashii]
MELNLTTIEEYTHQNTNIFTIAAATTTIIIIIVSLLYFFPLPFSKKSKTAPTDTYSTSNEIPKPTPVASSFKWDEHPPLKSYPFKDAIYKLTMGIRTIDISDWLLIEPTYLKSISHKVRIINNKHEDYPADKDLRNSTLFVTPEAADAIREFYDMVMTYLVTKYPMYFKVKDGEYWNLITEKKYPVNSEDVEDVVKLEEYLAENIEEDFIILLKDDQSTVDEYYFKAGVFAFAAGFNPQDRFNKPLSFIHHPVPSYESKLKLSMNRYFQRMTPGQFITRSNFSVQTHGKYYVDDSNKGHNLPEGFVQTELPYEELDFENQVHYRSERQTLTKLPKSGAVVFTIRTYLMPIAQVKAEGEEVAMRLKGAIEKLPPDIASYKRADEWGPAVCRYLSE